VEFSVLIRQVEGAGFRASCNDLLPTSADGVTRAEALAKLRAEIERQMTGGIEVVRLRIDGIRPTATVWPDDEITSDWLAGISAARADASDRQDPWDVPDTADPS